VGYKRFGIFGFDEILDEFRDVEEDFGDCGNGFRYTSGFFAGEDAAGFLRRINFEKPRKKIPGIPLYGNSLTFSKFQKIT
jgi:hypothetical protein